MSSPSIAVHLDIQARYVLLTALAEGKRILDIGCRDGRGLALLAEAEAAEIAATSDVPDRVSGELAAAGVEGVEIILETDGPLPFADGAFDLVVCHDLPERLAAGGAIVDELRRVLDRDGHLALAVANPQGRWLSELWGERPRSPLTYEALYAQLAPVFGTMTAFGQSPLVACLFYDVASEEEEPGLVFDRSLMNEDDQPGWYVLLFGPQAVTRDDLNIVQLPFAELRRAGASAVAPGDGAGEPGLEADSASITALEAEAASLRSRLADSEARAEALEAGLAEQAQERDAALARAEALATAAPEADADLTERRVLEAQAAAQREEIEQLRRELAAEGRSGGGETELEMELANERRCRTELEAQLTRARHDGESLESQIRDLLEETTQLRRALEEAQTTLRQHAAADGLAPEDPGTAPDDPWRAAEASGLPAAGGAAGPVSSILGAAIAPEQGLPELSFDEGLAVEAEASGYDSNGAAEPTLLLPGGGDDDAQPAGAGDGPPTSGEDPTVSVEVEPASPGGDAPDATTTAYGEPGSATDVEPPASPSPEGAQGDPGTDRPYGDLPVAGQRQAGVAPPPLSAVPGPSSLDDLLASSEATAADAGGLDALLAEAGVEIGSEEGDTGAGAAGPPGPDEPMLGELNADGGTATPPSAGARARGPVTLDDLEDLIATSIPPPASRR